MFSFFREHRDNQSVAKVNWDHKETLTSDLSLTSHGFHAACFIPVQKFRSSVQLQHLTRQTWRVKFRQRRWCVLAISGSAEHSVPSVLSISEKFVFRFWTSVLAEFTDAYQNLQRKLQTICHKDVGSCQPCIPLRLLWSSDA